MKTTVETVTPAQAIQWLGADVNFDNRNLRPSHVAYLCKQMLDGEWKTTHQGIAFASDGRLLDGQHRLAAVVRSKIAVQMQVSRDVDPESFSVLDCGIKRTHYDRVLLVDDKQINKTLCTALAYFVRQTKISGQAIPVSEIVTAFDLMTDSWLWMAGMWVAPMKGLKYASVMSSIAVYHFINRERAELFNDGYMSGTGLESGDPVLALRDAIFRRGDRVDYWVAQAAMRQHLLGKSYKAMAGSAHLYASSEDMLGNRNSIALIKARAEAGKKGALSRAKLKEPTNV